MPWHVVQNHSECPTSRPWAVVKDDDGAVEGCHASEGDADDQLAALYAAEADEELGALAEEVVDLTTRTTMDLTITTPDQRLGGKPNPGTKPDKRLRRNRMETKAEVGDVAELTGGPTVPWRGVLAVEGVETGDGREFAPSSLEWGEPPLPLMWQRESEPQHMRSVVVGRIDSVSREGSDIIGEGTVDLGSEDGLEVARQMGYDAETGTIDLSRAIAGGISVDVDSVKDSDVELVFPDSGEGDSVGETDEGDILMLFGPPPEKVVFHRGRLRGATLVALPAFIEARIALVDSSAEEEGLVASLLASREQRGELVAAGVVPVAPPAAWFRDPALAGPTSWTVEDSGRVFGHLALWGVCHTTFNDQCVTPPRERDYPYYQLGELRTGEGETLGVGQITFGTGHYSGSGAVPAVQHYDHTGHVAADVVVGEDRFGIWVSGALRPGLDDARVRELRAAKLSGDWRKISNRLRLVAVLAVNVPGFPVPRMRARFDGEGFTSLVAAGIVTDQRREAYGRVKGDGLGTLRVRKVVK